MEGETSLPLQSRAVMAQTPPPTVHVQTAQPSHTCKNIGFKNEQRELEFNEAVAKADELFMQRKY